MRLLSRKDNYIASIESKNKILMANKIDLESRLADILEESDEILRKYDKLRQINGALQEKLELMEQDMSRAE